LLKKVFRIKRLFKQFFGYGFIDSGSGTSISGELSSGSSFLGTSNHETYCFSNFVVHFYPPGSGFGSSDLIESGSNPDPKTLDSSTIFGTELET
jgi:hypothetical protein